MVLFLMAGCGLVALLSGRFNLLTRRIRGVRARLVGICLLLPFPLALVVVVVMGVSAGLNGNFGDDTTPLAVSRATISSVNTICTLLCLLAAAILTFVFPPNGDAPIVRPILTSPTMIDAMTFPAKPETDTEAIARLTGAILLKPQDENAYLARGRLFHARGDYVDAAADFRQALALDPLIADATTLEIYIARYGSPSTADNNARDILGEAV